MIGDYFLAATIWQHILGMNPLSPGYRVFNMHVALMWLSIIFVNLAPPIFLFGRTLVLSGYLGG